LAQDRQYQQLGLQAKMSDKHSDKVPMLPQQSEESDLPPPSDQGALRMDIWAKSIGLVLVFLGPSCILGITVESETLPLGDGTEWVSALGLKVALPAVIFYIISGIALSRLPTFLGFGMIQEKCRDISLKDAVVGSQTTNGVTLALFLTIFLAMLQADGKDEFTLFDGWYRALCIMGTEACLRGLVLTCACLIYMQPLGDKAAAHFAVDNLIYLGEPTACILSAGFFLVQATIAYVFNMYSRYIGLTACFVLGYSILRGAVCMQYLDAWENRQLSDDQRRIRRECLTACQKIDGTS